MLRSQRLDAQRRDTQMDRGDSIGGTCAGMGGITQGEDRLISREEGEYTE